MTESPECRTRGDIAPGRSLDGQDREYLRDDLQYINYVAYFLRLDAPRYRLGDKGADGWVCVEAHVSPDKPGVQPDLWHEKWKRGKALE